MRKTLSLSIVLTMIIVCLSGCSTSPESALVGEWVCEIDTTNFLNENIGEYQKYFKFQDIVIKIRLKFTDNNTYTFSYDNDSIQDMLEKTRTAYEEGISVYLDDLISDMGVDISTDEFLEMNNMSVDGLLDEMMRQAELSATFDPLEGEYWIRDNELHLVDSRHNDSQGDGELFNYSLDEGMLNLYIGDEASVPEEMSSLIDFFPIAFEKN